MNILKNEMRQGLKGLLLWGLIIGGTIVLCVALFPDLKKEFGDMVDAMADMGGFGALRLSLARESWQRKKKNIRQSSC